MATIIVLNGTSSSGKTTLARVLQEQAATVLLNFSIDSVLYALPPRLIQNMISGEPLTEISYRDLVRAYYRCLKELADLGHSLISDNAITTQWQAELLVGAVEGHRAILVGIDCSAETVESRERARGDRRVGLARSQLPNIHKWLQYDVTVNSESQSLEDAAAIILRVANIEKVKIQN